MPQSIESKYLEAEDKYDKAEDAVRNSDLHTAQILLREVIELNPKFSYAYILLARVYWKSGFTDKAKQILEKCISIDRSFGYSYYLLAKYTRADNDIKLSDEYISRGLKNSPEDDRLQRIHRILKNIRRK
ncbi:MAG TPA: tetratricopeptide repeat protein [Spirochaetota bacterium]|nr:tetratricopeptide repeat protein [Spirochaetota bacterium]